MNVSIRFFLTLAIAAATVVSAAAQAMSGEPTNTIEEQAYPLLEDVIAGTQTLKLPENRGRLQIIAANLLWRRDQLRARSLFVEAAANVAELERQIGRGLDPASSQRQSAARLRQELVLTAARHDADLAYQLLQKSRQQKAGISAVVVLQNDTYLEQLLRTQITTKDSSLAIQRAEDMLHRGDSIDELNDLSKSRGLVQLTYLTPQGTSSNLVSAAQSAPTEMRALLYQQAALKAVDEGRTEGARQIANDHLDTQMRKVVFERIAAQQQFRKDVSTQLEELRQTLDAASDHDRVGLLLQLAEATTTHNPKQSRELLDEAYGLATPLATNYKQLEDQLQLARAFGAIEPQRSLQVLELGINQINELLPAAASLSGFEVHIFIDGEMSLPGGSQLGAVVIRYGEELARLAKSDFRGAVSSAEQFRYPEARLFARLSILQAVLE